MSLPNSNPPRQRLLKPLGPRLERLYAVYADARYLSPDPLEMVVPFRRVEDREIAALAASSLAYGRVLQILKSLQKVFGILGEHPSDYVRSGNAERFRRDFRGFKHRFHTGEDLANLLEGVRIALDRHGSLESCFAAGFDRERDATVRLVRQDAVDPGGWTRIPPSHLIVPLDTHLHRIARELGLTRRKAADRETALEITEAFREIFPDDPVKADFVLTRFGIHPDFGRDPLEKC